MQSDPLDGATPVGQDPLDGATAIGQDPLASATPAGKTPTLSSGWDLARVPTNAMHAANSTLGVVGGAVRSAGKILGDTWAPIHNALPYSVQGLDPIQASAEGMQGLGKGAEDLTDYAKQASDADLAARGSDPNSYVSRGSAFVGTVAGEAAKFANPYGAVLMVGGAGSKGVTNALEQGYSIPQAAQKGLLDATGAYFLTQIPGGNAAVKNLTKAIAIKATQGTLEGTGLSAYDALVDKVTLDKSLTPQQFRDSVVSNVAMMLGFKAVGMAAAMKAIKAAKPETAPEADSAEGAPGGGAAPENEQTGPKPSGRGNAYDSAKAKADAWRYFYEDGLGKCQNGEQARQFHDGWQKKVGPHLGTFFDELFPRPAPDWEPPAQGDSAAPAPPESPEAVSPSPGTPSTSRDPLSEAEAQSRVMKIQGQEPITITDPETIGMLERAEQQHQSNVDSLKNEKMTSAERAEAIRKSGDEFLVVKKYLAEQEKQRALQVQSPGGKVSRTGETGQDQTGSGEGVRSGVEGAETTGSGNPETGPEISQAETNQITDNANGEPNALSDAGRPEGDASTPDRGGPHAASAKPQESGGAPNAQTSTDPRSLLSDARRSRIEQFAATGHEPNTLPGHLTLAPNADPVEMGRLGTGTGAGESVTPNMKGTLPSGTTFVTDGNAIDLSLPSGGGELHMSVFPSKGLVNLDTIHINEGLRGAGVAKNAFQEAAKLIQSAYPEIRVAAAELTTPEAHILLGSYPNAVIKGNQCIVPIADLAHRMTKTKPQGNIPEALRGDFAGGPGQSSAGRPSGRPGREGVSGSSLFEEGLGPGPTADLFGGQGAYEAFCKKFGIEPGTSNETGFTIPKNFFSQVLAKIMGLGKTAKETVLRLLGKFKGMGRDLAEKMADYMHSMKENFFGTKRGQRGAVGPDIEGEREGKDEDRDMPYADRNPKEEENAQAQRGRDILSQESATVRMRDVQRKHLTWDSKKMLDKLPVRVQHGFFNIMEGPEAGIKNLPDSVPAKLKANLLEMRRQNEERYAQMEKLGIAPDYIENYFAHLWKNPGKARSAFSSYAHAPLEGTKSSTKKRTIPTIQEGINLGLEPLYDNPFDMWYAASLDQDKYVFANIAWDKFEKEGLIQYFMPGAKVPEDWVKLEDKIASKFVKGKTQFAYAPPSIAKPFNNYLSPGFHGKLYEAAKTVSNAMNQISLSLSGYHFFFVSGDMSAVEIGRSIQAGLQDHDTADAGRHLWNGLALGYGQTKAYKLGKAIQEAILSSTDPEWDKVDAQNIKGLKASDLQDLLTRGGLNAKNDSEYSNRMVRTLGDSLNRMLDKTIPASQKAREALPDAARGAMHLIQSLSHPLMEAYVPRIKLAAYFKILKDNLDRADAMGITLTDAQKTRLCRRVGDIVEDRMGQLAYDNLFWNKKAKQLAMLAFRSVGWNVGSMRDVGTTVGDIGKLLAEYERLHRNSNPDPRSNANRGMAGTHPFFTDRMATNIGSLVFLAVVGSLVNRLFSGKSAKSAKDLYAPQTGGHPKNGHPSRVMIPSYFKDQKEMFNAAQSAALLNVEPAFEFMKSKVGPFPNLLSEVLTNKDWRGNEVYDSTGDSALKRGWQISKHAAGASAPIGLSKMLQDLSEGKGAKAVLPVAGLMPPPSKIANSDAENMALKLVVKKSAHALTREQADSADEKKAAFESAAAGDYAPLNELRKTGSVTPKQATAGIKAHQNQDYLLALTRRLDAAECMKVFEVADAAEKEKLVRVIGSKLGKYIPTIPIKDRKAFIDKWNEMKSSMHPKNVLDSLK